MAEISKALRRDRETAFYDSKDLIPSGFYTPAEAERAFEDARWIHGRVSSVVAHEGKMTDE